MSTARAQLADPEGDWPTDGSLAATCRALGAVELVKGQLGKDHIHDPDDPDDDPEDCLVCNHGPIPGEHCRCGIYATTSLKVINGYLLDEAPVLGIVELGGRTTTGHHGGTGELQGYRAQVARVAVILKIDPMFTLAHPMLDELAETYHVPAVVPHSTDPEDYRRYTIEADAKDIDEEFREFFPDAG